MTLSLDGTLGMMASVKIYSPLSMLERGRAALAKMGKYLNNRMSQHKHFRIANRYGKASFIYLFIQCIIHCHYVACHDRTPGPDSSRLTQSSAKPEAVILS